MAVELAELAADALAAGRPDLADRWANFAFRLRGDDAFIDAETSSAPQHPKRKRRSA